MKYTRTILTILTVFIFANLSFATDPYTMLKSSDGKTNLSLRKADNGNILYIPFSTYNRHYKKYLKWIADGNTPNTELKKEPNYIDEREKEYPKTVDQLDRIMKTIKYLKDNGIDIGSDGEALISECEAVKQKYPKK